MSERAKEYYQAVAERHRIPPSQTPLLLGRAVMLGLSVQLHSIERSSASSLAETERVMAPVTEFLGAVATSIAWHSVEEISSLPIRKGQGVFIRRGLVSAKSRRLKNFTNMLSRQMVSPRIQTGTLNNFTLEALSPDEVPRPSLRSVRTGAKKVQENHDRAFYARIQADLTQGARKSTVQAVTQWWCQPLYLDDGRIATALNLNSAELPHPSDDAWHDLSLSKLTALALQEDHAARATPVAKRL